MSEKNGLDWVFIVDFLVKENNSYSVFVSLPVYEFSSHSPLGKIQSGKITNYEITGIQCANELPPINFDKNMDIFELNDLAKKLYDMDRAELKEYCETTFDNELKMGNEQKL